MIFALAMYAGGAVATGAILLGGHRRGRLTRGNVATGAVLWPLAIIGGLYVAITGRTFTR